MIFECDGFTIGNMEVIPLNLIVGISRAGVFVTYQKEILEFQLSSVITQHDLCEQLTDDQYIATNNFICDAALMDYSHIYFSVKRALEDYGKEIINNRCNCVENK